MRKMYSKTRGYIMFGAGFFMIIVNALSYLLGWQTNFTPIGIIGLVFVAIGTRWVRENKRKK